MSAQGKKLYNEWCDEHADEIVEYAINLEESGEQWFVSKTVQYFSQLLEFRSNPSACEWLRSRIKRIKDGLSVKGFCGGVPLIGFALDNIICDLAKQMSIANKCIVNTNEVSNIIWTVLDRPENASTKAKAIAKKAKFGSSWVARAKKRWKMSEWLSEIDFEVTQGSTDFIIIPSSIVDVSKSVEREQKLSQLEAQVVRERQFVAIETERLKVVASEIGEVRLERERCAKETQLLKEEAADVESKRKLVELQAQKIKDDAAEVDRKRKELEEKIEQLKTDRQTVANEYQHVIDVTNENERIRVDVECKRKMVDLETEKIREVAAEVERKRQYVELLEQRIKNTAILRQRTKEVVTDLDDDSVTSAFEAHRISSDEQSHLSMGQSLCNVAPLVNVENSNGTTLTSSEKKVPIVPVLLKRKRVIVGAQVTCADVFKHIDAYLVDKNDKLVRSVNGGGQFEKYIECGYLQIDAEYGSSKSVLGLVQLKFGLSTVAKNIPMVLATSAVDGLLTFSPTEDDFLHCAIWVRKCAEGNIYLEIECISKLHNDTIHYVPACTKTTDGCVIFQRRSHELENESRFVLVGENGTNVRRELFKYYKSKGPFIEKCLSSRAAYFEYLNGDSLSGGKVTSDDVDLQQEDSKRLRTSSTGDDAIVRVSKIMALQDCPDDVAPEFMEAFKVGGDEAVYALLAKKFTQLNAHLLSRENSFIRRVSPARNNCMYASISVGLSVRYGDTISVGDMKKQLKAFMKFNEAALLPLSNPFLVPVMEVVKDSNGQACLECCSLYRDGFHLRMKEKQELVEDENGDPYLRTVCEGGLEGGRDFKLWVDRCFSALGNQTVLQCAAALYGLEILVFTTKSIMRVTHLSIPNLRHKGPPPRNFEKYFYRVQ